MKLKSDFLNLLNSRGYIYQCTNLKSLDDIVKSQKITAYIGFDCTAKSLHVGSLIQIMILRYLQKFNHKPIILLGGGTTKIGDPSGKDESRKILSEEDIKENTKQITILLEKFTSFNKENLIFIDNSQWLDNINYIGFLRNIGKYFSVNKMLSFDSVKLRLERQNNLSFLEFNYMLLQAYDFVELYKRYGCLLQIGGSDQWGNIVNGVDLAKKLKLPEIFGLTTPLVLTSSGEKMGKTGTGKTIWLNGDMTSPYSYWQYFRNVDDRDVGKFLRLFTELSLQEIEKLELLKDAEINEAKKILATEATKICHGEKIAEEVAVAAIEIFEKNNCAELLVFKIDKKQFDHGISLVKLLLISGLEKSAGDAKRLIKGEGCKINDIIIRDINTKLSNVHFDGTDYIKLSCGKKRHIKVVLVNELT